MIQWHKTFLLEAWRRSCNIDSLDVVFDVGAYNGAESMEFVNLFNSKVYAFEPLSTYYINNDNIHHIKSAVSQEDGVAFLYVPRNIHAASLKIPTQIHDKIEVSTIRLDTFMDIHHIEQIDMVWVDVQGAELDVLKSLGDKIQDIKYLYIEADIKPGRYKNQSYMSDIVKYIKPFGFESVCELTISDIERHAIFSNPSNLESLESLEKA